MQIAEEPPAAQMLVHRWRCEGHTIGFVPTMGALHEGHRSLLVKAKSQCDRLVASLFVNPLQFGPHEDYGRYPRTAESDRRMLADSGCDLLFAPSVQTMYGAEQPVIEKLSSVDVPCLGDLWEGTHRAGHFKGVATVVSKLLHISMPHKAYFGEKDYQQLKVIEKMVRDLNFPVQVVPVETVRERDGLALSSRNIYLTAAERTAAPVLYKAMRAGVDLARTGERSSKVIIERIQTACAREPLMSLHYTAIVDTASLEPVDQLEVVPARVLIAAKLGNVRLIDNCEINTPGS